MINKNLFFLLMVSLSIGAMEVDDSSMKTIIKGGEAVSQKISLDAFKKKEILDHLKQKEVLKHLGEKELMEHIKQRDELLRRTTVCNNYEVSIKQHRYDNLLAIAATGLVAVIVILLHRSEIIRVQKIHTEDS